MSNKKNTKERRHNINSISNNNNYNANFSSNNN